MTTTSGKLFMVRGTLRVEARGYWFSAGGDKGSFGYYPHLKNRHGYPLYPDTQIHGDLRMAVMWLERLRGVESPDSLVALIFGADDGQGRALLKETDLTLAQAAIQQWDPIENFQTKTRIRIGRKTHVVDKHFLVSREMAWMGNSSAGTPLEAEVYLGYTTKRDLLEKMRDLLDDASRLLSGFGAFRSRGVGRGRVRIDWREIEEIHPSKPADANRIEPRYTLFLESLVNMRNRPVSSGQNRQTVESRLHIAREQMRAWFAVTWHRLFGSWPTPEEMDSIRFSAFYPSTDCQIAYPPPMTTVCNERNEVRDCYENGEAGVVEDITGTFFETKTRPLDGTWFVTDSDPVHFVAARPENRYRNAMEKYRFQTRENGLFVQELVRKGTIFGGTVTLSEPQSEFAARAVSLLSTVMPTINGTFFKPYLRPCSRKASPDGSPVVLVEPVSYVPSEHGPITAPDTGRRIILATKRAYNTRLGRPRRGRISLAPGSILPHGERSAVAWKGLGKRILGTLPVTGSDAPAAPETVPSRSCSDLGKGFDFEKRPDDFITISRSHAGELRKFLLWQDVDQVKNSLEHTIEKWRKKDPDSHYLKVCEEVLRRLGDGGDQVRYRNFIRAYLEELKLYYWNEKAENKCRGAGHEN